MGDNDAVTIRELLTHTGGVDNPGELFGTRVPSLVSLTGPGHAGTGPRGTFSYSNRGYRMLGQLIAAPAWSGRELAGQLHVKPRNLLTQRGEWARLGFFTRTPREPTHSTRRRRIPANPPDP